ncbi:uncharacterized protein AMSG_02488 [Thecamonas trahens ATCC 50062]|uniref:Leishmanolysin n=1 Tax=Thecamonas trahens ATCC 50062 TaxID=461836 RepID=A0A0L0D5V9_THETB|nr:hypothetical protein AMSG_02488 [Thecamonas trahens ATCC 50062]KNC47471.1 hypothetical protein AMSG_02488 [Thecamonas trahens ATCC 50062]|eukprot:XP_013759407.1 hypothetical protein AMSG_02488 [Thecamonas trahens ATCC 50062]
MLLLLPLLPLMEMMPFSRLEVLIVLFDTSLFDNDLATRVCNADGAAFAIGDGSGGEACSATKLVNCNGVCSAAMLWPAAKASFMTDQVLPAVADRLSAALSVISPAAIVFAAQGGTDCGASDYGPATIPQSYIDTPTTSADVVIFVTRRPMLGGAQAVGVECLQNQLGRPLAGHLNVAPQYIDPNDLQGAVDVVLHEALHILGFSFSKFSAYLNEFGELYADESPARPVVASTTTSFGNTIRRLNTPRVTAVARQHYDCARAVGLELEDGGGVGIFKSHWEKRLLMNEIMTGRYESLPPPALSVFTLAALEDSGWYVADYSTATPLRYGFRQGCEFFDGQCSTWTGDGYYCNTSTPVGCNFDRSAKSECIVTEWAIIPSAFQYFNNPTTGGYSELADFCPIYTPTSDGACAELANAAVASPGAEQFGASSKCFLSTVRNMSLSYTGNLEPRCYLSTCAGDETSGYTLSISVGGSAPITCPARGGMIEFPGFQGAVQCPPAAEVCRTPFVNRPPVPTGSAAITGPSLVVIALAGILAVLGAALA